MSTLTTFLSDITFFEIGMSLIVLGMIEQVYIRLPDEVVGPDGWLRVLGTSK